VVNFHVSKQYCYVLWNYYGVKHKPLPMYAVNVQLRTNFNESLTEWTRRLKCRLLIVVNKCEHFETVCWWCFCVRPLSVLRGHSVFSPRHNGQCPPTAKGYYTRSYPLHYFLILILEKEPVIPISMLSAKQGNYWYHFYNVVGIHAVLDWWLKPGPPTLEASTIPLGYRGGGVDDVWN